MNDSAGWREALAAYIRTEARPVEKYGHQPRLYALTQQIGQGLSYDDDVVYAAAWLHDLGVFVGHRPEDHESLARWNNTAYAMTQAPALLVEFGFPDAKIAAVLACIRSHQPTGEPRSIEATILRDADILEQLGAVGILRAVAKIGRDTRFHTFTDVVEALRRALDQLPALLRLPQAQAMVAERVALHEAFLQACVAEAGEHLH